MQIYQKLNPITSIFFFFLPQVQNSVIDNKYISAAASDYF